MATENMEAPGEAKPKLVTVSVNGNPVEVPHTLTGAELKQAAIDQGVPIQLDFNLYRKRGNDYDPIDDERLETHQGEEFRCVAPDDVA
jgi:hypothetical protein